MKSTIFLISFFSFMLHCLPGSARIGYGAVATYGFPKVIPSYTGNALPEQRAPDNGVADIGFDTCGNTSGVFSIVSGATKSVVGDIGLFTMDAANISTNFYYTIGTQNTRTTSSLPVEMLSFKVTCNTNKVDISWTTAVEKNNNNFSIERMQEGTAGEIIGFVKGVGNTSRQKNYNFQDERPLQGIAYYRLRQTDADNKETFYRYEQISCEANNEGIKIYPNPNKGTFILEGTKLYSDIEVIDVTGKVIYGQKNIVSKQEIKIDNLVQGIYFVRITDSSKQTNLKMIVTY